MTPDLVVAIPVTGGRLASLAPTIESLRRSTAAARVHVRFLAEASAGRGAIQDAAAALGERFSWDIDAPEGDASPKEMLARLAGEHPGLDVALVWPGTGLAFAWDARLRKAALAEPRIGAAVPLCDADPLFALVPGGASPPDAERIDRNAYCLGDRSYYEVPALHGAGAYLCAPMLADVLPALGAPPGWEAFLTSLAVRMRERGWSAVILDHLYVGAGQDTPVGHCTDLDRESWQVNSPLGGLRRAIDDAIRTGLAPASRPGLDHRPVKLHVMHFWGGGLERWVRDYARADTGCTNLILATFRIGERGGQRIVLYSDPESMVPVRTWDIARPILSTTPSSLEYRQVLEQVVREFAVEAVIVSSLIGHGLDALRLPLPTIVVCHDFYPVCQAINPQFGTTCRQCTLEDLKRCGASNPLNVVFRGHDAAAWHEMRSRYVEAIVAGKIALVTPSASVAHTLRELEPRLQGHPIRVIAHGSDFHAEPLAPRAPAAGQRLRLAVLGRLSIQKGLALLREAAPGLQSLADVTLLGCGKAGVELASQFGWKAIERYELAELRERLQAIEPHAVVLPSVVPETFSYALTELWALGLPPLATRLGSFAERIEDGRTGLLFEPDAASLVALVRRLQDDPGPLAVVARALAAPGPGRSTADMVRDYASLLPLEARPVARYRIGIGRQSGLTEPYRQLNEAYAQVQAAYNATRAAYDEQSAYREDLEAMLTRWSCEFTALGIRRHPWRIGQAMVLTRELREELASRGIRLSDAAVTKAAPEVNREPILPAIDPREFPHAESLFPARLKSPWWIGHIPFAFELIGRLRPRVVVELGTYSGSSFAAFCQAVGANGIPAKCYGIDLWQGDVHMGRFEEELFEEISAYMAANYPDIAVLVRKDFTEAASDFADGSVDLLHIDGTHTREAVMHDYRTWRPKMSPRGVILFHDLNVTVENAGPAAARFGVRQVFDEIKGPFPHGEFAHCWGLGVLAVGPEVPEEVLALLRRSSAPEVAAHFERKGDAVVEKFNALGTGVALHAPYEDSPPPLLRRTVQELATLTERIRKVIGA